MKGAMEDHFSIAEAAAELHMSAAAVLRACLNEQLVLSIRFSGRNLPYAKLRRQLPMEAGYPPGRVKTAPLGLYDMAYTLGSDRSLWTLVMAGAGRLCVEDEYQKAIGRVPAISDSSPSSRLGVFVLASDDSMSEPGYVMLYELVEYRGTAPANKNRDNEDFRSVHVLPAGSEIVVSKAAVTAFQAKRAAGLQAADEDPQRNVPGEPEGVPAMRYHCPWSLVALALAERQTIESEEQARKTLHRQGNYRTPVHDKPFPFPSPDPSPDLIAKYPALASSPRDANAKLKLLHHRATEYEHILENMREAGVIKFYKPGTMLRMRDDSSVRDPIVYLDEVGAEIVKYSAAHADESVDAAALREQVAGATPPTVDKPSADRLNREKLTVEQRREIIKRVSDGEKGMALAKEFDVSHQYVSKICREARVGAQPKNWAFGKNT